MRLKFFMPQPACLRRFLPIPAPILPAAKRGELAASRLTRSIILVMRCDGISCIASRCSRPGLTYTPLNKLLPRPESWEH